jgi:hypothetical protein
MDSQERKSLNGSARSLRIINILTFIPGFILIAALIKPAGALYLIPAAPLTLSALLGLVCVAGGGQDRLVPWWTAYADLCIAMLFLGVLIPMYVLLLCSVTGWLAGYTSRNERTKRLSIQLSLTDLFFLLFILDGLA